MGVSSDIFSCSASRLTDALPAPSALHPLHQNPQLALSADLAPVSRKALLVGSQSGGDDDDDDDDSSGAGDEGPDKGAPPTRPFARDREGESVLQAMLLGLLGPPPPPLVAVHQGQEDDPMVAASLADAAEPEVLGPSPAFLPWPSARTRTHRILKPPFSPPPLPPSDFRLYASQPLTAVRLVPLLVEHHIPSVLSPPRAFRLAR